jgi:hypothetical protein
MQNFGESPSYGNTTPSKKIGFNPDYLCSITGVLHVSLIVNYIFYLSGFLR